jgi:hypothetical protein
MIDGLERRGELWTAEENAALTAAGDKGEEWGAIGVRLQRTRWACKVQYHFLKRGGTPEQLSKQRIQRQHATALAKAIRNTRPQHRSITAEFFGDPLPGRSALDQRLAGQGGGVRSVSLATGPMQ